MVMTRALRGFGGEFWVVRWWAGHRMFNSHKEAFVYDYFFTRAQRLFNIMNLSKSLWLLLIFLVNINMFLAGEEKNVNMTDMSRLAHIQYY